MPGCEMARSEIRCRVKPKEKFDDESYRRKHVKGGIDLVVACPKGHYDDEKERCDKGMKVQSVRFKKDKWDKEEAKDWIKGHKSLR